MSDHASLAKQLQEALELRLPPIAVCVVDAPPSGVAAFAGAVAAGCAFWEKAAAGAFVTSPDDHASCAIGMHTHHIPMSEKAQGELGDVLGACAQLGYVREEDIPGIPVLAKEARHVVYAPLADAPSTPEVVLLFAHAAQSLVITEAVERVEGQGAPPAMGRPACAVVPAAANSGRAAMSLGCCGARAYLDALTDDVALWALPGSKLAEYAEAIGAFATTNAMLGTFHALRREDVEAGKSPTVKESLERLQSAGA